MKSTNRKSLLIMLGIVEVALFIYMIVLHGKGSIDNLSFVIGFFILAAVTMVGVVVAFYRYPWTMDEKKDGFDPGSVEVPRTREGTIFEVLAGLLLVIAWTVAIASHRFVNAAGGLDFKTMFGLFILTILAISALWDVYSPGTMPLVNICKNVHQVGLHIRMLRVLGVELSALVLLSALPDGSAHIGWLSGLMVLLVVTYAVFRYLIYKARSIDNDKEG